MSNPLSPRIFKKLIKNKIDFNMSCITIRRSAVIWALDYIGKIKAWPDTVLFLIVSQYGGRIKLDNRMLTAYRIHSSNVSNLHDSRTMCVYLSKIKKNYAERIEASNTILDCVNDITLVKFLRERSAVWNSSLLIIEENVEKKEILHWIKQVFLASIRVRTVSVIIIIPLGILLINARFSKLLYYKIISAYFSKLRF